MSGQRSDGVDFIVIGNGIAALRAAIELAEAGRVAVLGKGEFFRPGAHNASLAAACEEDELGLHVHNTRRAGDGLSREEAVRILAEEAPRRIEEIVEWARCHDRGGPRLVFEHAPTRSRVLRAAGESACDEILRTLAAHARSLPSLELRPHVVPVELVTEEGRVCGVSVLDEKTLALEKLRARAVLLATGGLGQVYSETTNPPSATGDGVSLAWRAGALLSDLEFVQFHPTTLHIKGAPPLLLPEGLRIEGAQLRNIEMTRFMTRYHEAGELAPADVLARALMMEIQRTEAPFVYLDLTRLKPQRLQERFARSYNACLAYNLDISTDLLPVHPAAHHSIGGVATDLHGATTLEGLYAAGEVAATGLHGANSIPSNPPLEELVYGARVGSAMLAGKPRFTPPRNGPGLAHETSGATRHSPAPHGGSAPNSIAAQVRSLMWENVGIIRRGRGLNEAVRCLDAIVPARSAALTRASCESRNLLEVARLIARLARDREESRGSHYRADFPLRNDSTSARHSYVSRDSPVYFG